MSGKTFKIFYTTEINKQPVNQFKCLSAKVPYLCGQIITKGKINVKTLDQLNAEGNEN